ncbi:MAG: hypothetical protein ACJ74T_22570 [Pyrinomonadaceae bacterium]
MAKSDKPSSLGDESGEAGSAGTPGQAGDVDLSPHRLVERDHSDPDEVKVPPEVVLLVGYIGPSKRNDYIRLYQDLTFRNYYEIPKLGVVSTAPLNPDDENSPTGVQVIADTKLDVITISVQSVEARLLSGTISSGYLGGAAAQSAAAAQAQPLCTNITTYMPSCVQQPMCLTVVTANPTDCGQQCDPNCIATVVTSGVGPQGPGGPNLCTNITTYMPSCVAPPCTNITTHMPSCVGGQAPPPQFCITLHTYVPSFCNPNCVVIAHTAATLCTQIHYTGPVTVFCPTVYTAIPSGCEKQCITAGNTAATLCTQVPTGPTPI